MKNLIITSFFLCCVFLTRAQGTILEHIEQNNTVLSALREQMNAEKITNKTGLNPENPEVGFGYLWGNNKEIGNRTNVEVTQSFDFPTTYRNKRKMADIQNRQVDIRYLIERKDVLLEAQMICIQLIYQNALSAKLNEQLELTTQVADAYQRKFEEGEISILELNKATYDLLDAQKKYQTSIVEKEFLQAELLRLNGGNPIQLEDKKYVSLSLPADFDDWYNAQKEKNKELLLSEQEINRNRQNEKLQRSLNLPKLSAGYMSEKLQSEHFQGVTVGISIPLWENKNSVKQIKAQTIASKELQRDAELKSYYQSEALYKKASNLNQMTNQLKQHEISEKTVALLKKSLDVGEISLTDFILELGIYYELIQNILEVEKELHLTFAELMQWDL